MKYIFSRLSIWILCLIPTFIYAQQNLSLSQAIEIGLKNNYQIQIAENKLDLAKNNNSFANAGRYPTLDFNAGFNNSFTRQNDPREVDPFFDHAFLVDGWHASVDASWVLFDGFKVRINKKRLEELERQSVGNSQLVVEKTIQSIIIAYYEVLIQLSFLDILKSAKQFSEEQVNFVELKKEYGRAIKYDIIQAKDALLNDSINLLVQKNKVETALHNLSYTMGMDDLTSKYTLTDALSLIVERYEYKTLERRMLTSNKDLQLLQIKQSLIKIERDLAESERSPKVEVASGLYYGANRIKVFPNDGGPRFDPFPGNKLNSYLDFVVSYPLYDGGAKKRAIENSKIKQEIAMLTKEDIIRSLKVQLSNTIKAYDNHRQMLKVSNALVENANENLENSRNRFKDGQINFFDFRSVQKAYISASEKRLEVLFNLRNNETELLRLTGGLIR